MPYETKWLNRSKKLISNPCFRTSWRRISVRLASRRIGQNSFFAGFPPAAAPGMKCRTSRARSGRSYPSAVRSPRLACSGNSSPPRTGRSNFSGSFRTETPWKRSSCGITTGIRSASLHRSAAGRGAPSALRPSAGLYGILRPRKCWTRCCFPKRNPAFRFRTSY